MDHPSCAVQVVLLPCKTVVGHMTLNQNVHPWVPTKQRLKFEHRAHHAIEKIRCKIIFPDSPMKDQSHSAMHLNLQKLPRGPATRVTNHSFLVFSLCNAGVSSDVLVVSAYNFLLSRTAMPKQPFVARIQQQ